MKNKEALLLSSINYAHDNLSRIEPHNLTSILNSKEMQELHDVVEAVAGEVGGGAEFGERLSTLLDILNTSKEEMEDYTLDDKCEHISNLQDAMEDVASYA